MAENDDTIQGLQNAVNVISGYANENAELKNRIAFLEMQLRKDSLEKIENLLKRLNNLEEISKKLNSMFYVDEDKDTASTLVEDLKFNIKMLREILQE
jgi:hypothetical protein